MINLAVTLKLFDNANSSFFVIIIIKPIQTFFVVNDKVSKTLFFFPSISSEVHLTPAFEIKLET